MFAISAETQFFVLAVLLTKLISYTCADFACNPTLSIKDESCGWKNIETGIGLVCRVVDINYVNQRMYYYNFGPMQVGNSE